MKQQKGRESTEPKDQEKKSKKRNSGERRTGWASRVGFGAGLGSGGERKISLLGEGGRWRNGRWVWGIEDFDLGREKRRGEERRWKMREDFGEKE